MKVIDVDISKIKPYEKNPRDNEKAVDYVAKSILEYGFRVPIILDKNNVIVAGHTRLLAAKQLGLDTVPCIVADDLTDEQVRAFRIADNKVSDFSIWNNKLLLDELADIGDLFTGFDLSEDFNDVLDESENGIILDNQYGTAYEVTFRSEDRARINKITELWEKLDDEE